MVVWPESHRDLWLAAAVASGWPVLRSTGTLSEVEALLERIEALLGPLPQAVIDEPWDEGEVAGLEVALPDLDAEEALVLAELGDVWLTPGPWPTEARQLELGLRLDELLVFGPVHATRPIGLEGGIRPELARQPGTDPALLTLERELLVALQGVEPALQSWSDRGPDTVAAAVDPATGRFGVVVSLASDAFAPLDGEALLDLRTRVLEALAGVVLARAEHPTLRLAPDLLWWTALDGMEVVLWAVAPALPVSFPLVDREVWVVDPGGPEHPAQVAILPGEPGQFDAACERGAAVAEAVGASGGPGVWLRRAEGWSFAPTWYVDDAEGVEAFRR